MTRKHTKKRRPRRRRRRGRKAYPGRSMPGFPNNKLVRFRYATQIRLEAPAGAIDTHQFRANSLFDPDFTAGGHQPLGHDQWQVFYNHYVVIGSKITAKFTATAQQQPAQLLGIYTSDDATVPVQAVQIVENGLSRWRTGCLSNDGGGSQITITNTFSAKKMFNIANIKDNVDRLGAPMGANPTEASFYTLFIQGLNNLSNPDPVDVLVIIEYSALLSEPKTLAQS